MTATITFPSPYTIDTYNIVLKENNRLINIDNIYIYIYTLSTFAYDHADKRSNLGRIFYQGKQAPKA